MANFRTEYEWKSIQVIISNYLGTSKELALPGIRGFNYQASVEKELLYSIGDIPQSVQEGNISYTGQITLLQTDYEKIIADIGGSTTNITKGIEDASEDTTLTVLYLKNNKATTDILSNVIFSSGPKSWTQNQKFGEVVLDFMFLGLTTNIT